MNIRRGIFRIWVVLSTTWIFSSATVFWIDNNISLSPYNQMAPVVQPLPLKPFDLVAALNAASKGDLSDFAGYGAAPTPAAPMTTILKTVWKKLLLLSCGPPLVFYIMGVSTFWIIAGFRKRSAVAPPSYSSAQSPQNGNQS